MRKPMTEAQREARENLLANETKADRFRRLARPRELQAREKILLLKNLSSPQYEYTEHQIEVIFSSLQSALDEARKAFDKKIRRDKQALDI